MSFSKKTTREKFLNKTEQKTNILRHAYDDFNFKEARFAVENVCVYE